MLHIKTLNLPKRNGRYSVIGMASTLGLLAFQTTIQAAGSEMEMSFLGDWTLKKQMGEISHRRDFRFNNAQGDNGYAITAAGDDPARFDVKRLENGDFQIIESVNDFVDTCTCTFSADLNQCDGIALNSFGHSSLCSFSPLHLVNKTPVGGISAAAKEELKFQFFVPEGAKNLSFVTKGGGTDVELFVKHDERPTTDRSTPDNDQQCGSWIGNNQEVCAFTNPKGGNWQVLIQAWNNISEVSIEANYRMPGEDCDGSEGFYGGNDDDCVYNFPRLKNLEPVTGISASAKQELRYQIDVPAGMDELTIETLGGGTDVELFVKKGSLPTTDRATPNNEQQCGSWIGNNQEKCTFRSPEAGTWHVLIQAWNSFNDVNLEARYSKDMIFASALTLEKEDNKNFILSDGEWFSVQRYIENALLLPENDREIASVLDVDINQVAPFSELIGHYAEMKQSGLKWSREHGPAIVSLANGIVDYARDVDIYYQPLFEQLRMAMTATSLEERTVAKINAKHLLLALKDMAASRATETADVYSAIVEFHEELVQRQTDLKTIQSEYANLLKRQPAYIQELTDKIIANNNLLSQLQKNYDTAVALASTSPLYLAIPLYGWYIAPTVAGIFGSAATEHLAAYAELFELTAALTEEKRLAVNLQASYNSASNNLVELVISLPVVASAVAKIKTHWNLMDDDFSRLLEKLENSEANLESEIFITSQAQANAAINSWKTLGDKVQKFINNAYLNLDK